MHRKIKSSDVDSFTDHFADDEVQMEKDEDMVYKKGVLMGPTGTVSCKLMEENAVSVASQQFFIGYNHFSR